MYIRVHVTPGARKERVTKKSPDVFYISVKEPAERNLANTRVRQIIAAECGVALAQVRVLTGHQSSSKMISVG